MSYTNITGILYNPNHCFTYFIQPRKLQAGPPEWYTGNHRKQKWKNAEKQFWDLLQPEGWRKWVKEEEKETYFQTQPYSEKSKNYNLRIELKIEVVNFNVRKEHPQWFGT